MKRTLCATVACAITLVICTSCSKKTAPEPTKGEIAGDLSAAMRVAVYAKGMKITSQSKSSGLFGGGTVTYHIEAPTSQGTIFVGFIEYRLKKGRYVPRQINGHTRRPE